MKVLITDNINKCVKDIISETAEAVFLPTMSEEEIIKIIGEYDALMVRSQTKVNRNIIEAGKNLKIIGRAGVGVDNIDVNSATEKGIIVVNSPDGNTIAASEHTIALMLAISRNIVPASQSTKEGKWNRDAFTGTELFGKTLGVMGFGRIGKVLARKLAGLSAKVTCAARKDEDLAWIRAYGHMETNINTIGENLSDFDVIINTVPHLILTEERIKYVRDDCLLVDLASNPGGIDKKAAKNKNLKLIWALALPGKVAPVTTAEFIKDTVYNILKEIYKK